MTENYWSRTDLAYLAGIIDGEGCFSIYSGGPREFQLRVYVVNTNKDLIDWLQDTFGGLVYSRNSTKNPHWRTKYEWVLDGKMTEHLIPKVQPYLIIKGDQASLGLRFRKTFKNKKRPRFTKMDDQLLAERLFCYQEMKRLNNPPNNNATPLALVALAP